MDQIQFHPPQHNFCNYDIPHPAQRLHNCACNAVSHGYADAAIAMWRRAIKMAPWFVEALCGLGSLLQSMGEDEEGARLAELAITVDPITPRSAWGYIVLGRHYTAIGELQKAAEAFDRAMFADREEIEIVFDAAAAQLRLGNWDVGWALHTAANRGFLQKRLPVLPAGVPMWDGEPMRGHLLIRAHLGYGDQIMFARFLPWAKSRCDQLTVYTHVQAAALYSAYEQQGIDVVTELSGKYDAAIENFVLPQLMQCRPPIVPQVAPRRPSRHGQYLKVGIIWSGSDDTNSNPLRKLKLEDFLPLTADPRIKLYSFQVGEKSGDIGKAHCQLLVEDLSGKIEWDWMLTAKMMQQMDVMIVPDCGPAHLAGAMGIPTFLLLSSFPDWRWGIGVPNTPWYPSMRLFRQKRLADWKPVIAEVCEAIKDMHGAVTMGKNTLCHTVYGRMQVLTADMRGGELINMGRANDHPDIEMLCNLLKGQHYPVVIDAGANYGCFSLAFARAGATVFAFEPQIVIADLLEKNVELNSAGANIIVQKKALGAEKGTLRFDPPNYDIARDFGGESFGNEGEVEVECMAIDDMNLSRVNLLKIDVEGQEINVLIGARKTIERHRPIIFIEHHVIGELPIKKFLMAMNYRVAGESDRDLLFFPEEMTRQKAA